MTSTRQYQHPEAIVSAEWLASHLQDPAVQIYDCTTYLVAPDEQSAPEVVSGYEDYLQGHIPGAAFLDLQNKFSLEDSRYRFTMPPLDDLASRFANAGFDQSKRAVLYCRGSLQWATRIWWMLRATGFENAAILDGGWEHWVSENLTIETGDAHYSPGQYPFVPNPGLFTDKDGVLKATADPEVAVLNALSAQLHAGDSARYGRAGRIPGSVNVPAASLRQPASGLLPDAEQAARLFEDAGVSLTKPSVIYCGGGIAATLDGFIMHQLGATDISVYDHSLSEWCKDKSLPMETD